MKKNIIFVISILLILLLISACSEPSGKTTEPSEQTKAATATITPELTEEPTPEPTVEPTPEPTSKPPSLFGETTNGVHSNQVLGLSAEIPEGWQAATLEETVSLMGNLSADKLEQGFADESIPTLMVFFCSKHDVNSTDLNANVNMTITNSEWTADTLGASAASLEATYGQIDDVLGSSTTVTALEDIEINGVAYNYIVVESEMGDVITYQEVLITGVKDYTLTITCTYYEQSETDEIGGFLDSLEYQ